MTARRPMTVSPLWLQGSILTFIIGFSLLTFSAIRIYQDYAPIPERIVDEAGNVLFTRQQILDGQEQFLTYGLMQFGTVYGHGAYLGPDFTADYLHRMALHMNKRYGDDEAARGRTRRELQANRYDPSDGDAGLDRRAGLGLRGDPPALRRAGVRPEGERRGAQAGHDHRRRGCPRDHAFIAWTAWTGVARRPGKTYSYTNNWPPEELVGNTLTGDAIMWSALSLVTLLGGSGLVLGLYGRHSRVVGWHETEERQVRFVPPSSVALTPAQRVTAWFFLVVAALFLLQNLIGGATVHYMVETGGFFGIDLPRLLPYNLTRTWHLQMAIFFVATAYLAAGIFLAPLIAGREPRGQGLLVRLAARRTGGGRLRQPGRRVPELPRSLAPRAAVVLRGAGVGIPRARPVLDVPAHRRDGALGGDHLPGAAAPPGRREPGQPALAVPLQLAVDPGVLRGRPADPHPVPVRDRRLLAVLGRPPLGRGLPGAVHDDAGGLDLRADGDRLGAVRHAADLLRRDALLDRRRGRDAAPLLFQRRAGGRDGPGGVLLGGRGHPADAC